MEHGIKSCEEITYEIRLEFEDRLNKQRCEKKREYLKEMDRLKLETTEMKIVETVKDEKA